VRTAKVKIADPKALRKALKPQWNQVRGDRKWLDEAQGVTVVRLVGNNLPSFDLVADKVRVISIQPSVARVRLIGPYFDTNKAFVLPAVRRALPSVVFIQKELNAKRMLVVGHTDTTGRSSYNDQLSLDRAQAIKDFLLRDVSAWYKWYGPGMAAEKRWGSKEDLAMIDALPDGAERGGTETPIRWFQRTRGLVVDGVAGEKTRRALIAEYMNLDEKLLEESELVVHGCGESFPDKATEDDTEEPDNRRIEIFFFDTDLGILPAPTKQVSSAGSTDYPEWVRRSKRTDDFEQDGVSIALRIVDGLGEPLVGAPYELKAGSVQRAAKTDANGLLHEEQIPRATSCILRWALPPRPGDPSPAPPTYDFEREILLDFEGRERDEAARYRLHNLGYDSPDLNESVHDFQQDFGLARADWFDEKTWNELRRLHDDF
jgi:outer membrane protein OmpA-like peptidoglycan-associated protein